MKLFGFLQKHHWNRQTEFSLLEPILIGICFIVSVTAAILSPPSSPPQGELPLFPVGFDTLVTGREIYMARDIDELVNANPWRKDRTPQTLPVYENRFVPDYYSYVGNADFQQMETLLRDTARRLNMDVDSLPVGNDLPSERQMKQIREKWGGDGELPKGYTTASSLVFEDGRYRLQVDNTLTVGLEWKEPMALPKRYHFTSRDSTYREMYKTAQYLLRNYYDYIDMNNPRINISGGDRNIYGEQGYTISFFEGSTNPKKEFLNYHFTQARFYCKSDGKLFLSRHWRADLSQPLGEYPIVGVDEAQAILANGYYLSACGFDFPGEQAIRKVELMYNSTTYEDLWMPYYRFYVELGQSKEEDLTHYGIFYVPAVESRFFTNWDTIKH